MLAIAAPLKTRKKSRDTPIVCDLTFASLVSGAFVCYSGKLNESDSSQYEISLAFLAKLSEVSTSNPSKP